MFFVISAVLMALIILKCLFAPAKEADNTGEDDTKKIEDESVAAALMLQMLFWS